MNPDIRVLRAMNLLKSPELAPLVEYLQATRAETLEHLVQVADQNMVCRMQGKAQFLQEFLKLIEKSNTLNPVRHTGS